ncbi:hypothetical protein H2248_003492 [Termitomyces sp. 'cryptogamus']|nr:hypothetical protein H2248_003492 [Termitomyces sp. 'cryptogamus']
MLQKDALSKVFLGSKITNAQQLKPSRGFAFPMSQMALNASLTLLLRTLRGTFAKHLIQRCRYLGTNLWRFLQWCREFLYSRRCSANSPSRNPFHESFEGNKQRLSKAILGPAGNTQILPSSRPMARSQSRQSGWRWASHLSIRSSSSDIAMDVVPPSENDATSIMSFGSEQRGDAMTIHSANIMSSQTYVVLPRANGSRISLVLPECPSLRPVGDVVNVGASGTTVRPEEISDRIYPLLPTKVPRYKRKRLIKDINATCKISASQNKSSPIELPCGWKQLTHPEGQPYFYHAGKRIITECWIRDQQIFTILTDFINEFERFVQLHDLTQPDDADLLLEVNIEDGENWCGYYYVSALNHRRRGFSYTQLYLEYQYWYHWDLFPNVYPTTDGIYDLVANTIADARTDILSSRTSTVNYSREDLIEMTAIVDVMRNNKFFASNWCLGRFMQLIIKDRFINYHGEYGARLDSLQSIYSDGSPGRTWLIEIFSPLLFFAPNVHLKDLHELWVDKITIKPRWMKFFVKMNGQWGEHIVHVGANLMEPYTNLMKRKASILLNANVAFLSIPSNDPSNDSSILRSTRTAAQIASYLSVVASFASMLLALMLVRQHRTKEWNFLGNPLGVGKFHEYVGTHHHSKYGFEALAITYSLPYALLIYGMGTFLVAFLLMCFVRSTTTVRSIVGTATFLMCGLILLCIVMFGEGEWKRKLQKVWNWLTDKKERGRNSSASNQDGETETRRDNVEANPNVSGSENQDNAEVNQNGTESSHDAGSTEQDVGQKIKRFCSRLVSARSWRTGKTIIPV